MVVVFGTVCLDRTHVVPHLPEKGGYVEVSETVEAVGGEAWNTAFALSVWGTEQRLVCNSIGRGHTADHLVDMIREAGQPRIIAPDLDHKCPVCDIFVTPDGARTMFGRGFSTLGNVSDPEAIDFDGATWFTADSNAGSQAVRSAELSAKAGVPRYVMDFGDEIAYLPNDIWQSSTDRFAKKGDDTFNLAWVAQVADDRRCTVILTDGANGSFLAGPGMAPKHFPPFPCEAVFDSTGAGDCFRAGVLHGLDAGWPIGRCLAFGSAAASLKCGSLGATAGIPTLAEVGLHLARYGQVSAEYQLEPNNV